MPAILDRLVRQLRAKGHSNQEAHAIATATLKKSGNLNSDGSATAQGIRRGKMTPGERAKDRASKRSGRSTKEYKYNKRTNRATLK